MNARRLTIVFLIAVVAIVIIYDVIVELVVGSSATISDVVLKGSLKRPVIAFAVGFLCGHLFFPQ